MNLTEWLNQSVMDINYNLTKIFSDQAIENTPAWAADWNAALGGFAIIGVLVVAAVLLFFIIKERGDVADTKALIYAGLITTFIGILLFVVSVSGDVKLIEWYHLAPLVILTSVAIVVDHMNRRY